MSKSNVIILTEGGEGIGWGHILRCSSVAIALKEIGVRTDFLVDFRGDIVDSQFFSVGRWNDGSIIDYDMVIIDSYLADISCYEQLFRDNENIVVIDDNHRLRYPCGVIVNGLIGGSKSDYDLNCSRFLVGEEFVPLQPCYWVNKKRKIRNSVQDVLITMGGADPFGSTEKIIELLKDKDLNVHVVLGPSFENRNNVQSKYDNQVIFYNNLSAKEMKELMLKVDLAISASGQTTYELASTGTPSIFIGVAENQRLNIQNWQKSGFIHDSIWLDDSDRDVKIIKNIDKLKEYKARNKVSELGQNLVDGLGATRIAKEIAKFL